MSEIPLYAKKINRLILCSCIFLIAFILFYKWACLVCPSGTGMLPDSKYAWGNFEARPFNLDKTWYVWICFVSSQAFIQIYLLNFIFRKNITHEEAQK